MIVREEEIVMTIIVGEELENKPHKIVEESDLGDR